MTDDDEFDQLPPCFAGRHDFTATEAEWQTAGAELTCVCGAHRMTPEDADRARRFVAYLTQQSHAPAEWPTTRHAPQATTSAYDIR